MAVYMLVQEGTRGKGERAGETNNPRHRASSMKTLRVFEALTLQFCKHL